VLETVALEDADLGDRRFDKVFAFNVAPFWQQPEAALGAVREHLARDGAVYVFWDARHSAPERARDLGNELADRLREGGFSVDRVLVKDLRPVPAVCAMQSVPLPVKASVHGEALSALTSDDRRRSSRALYPSCFRSAKRERPGAPARNGRALDQSCSPALADIIGARRVLTVAMISSGSIPCR
jgi:hypothetical protein